MFQEKFKETTRTACYTMIDYTPSILSEVENDKMVRAPNMKEARDAEFYLHKDSACSLDIFWGIFPNMLGDHKEGCPKNGYRYFFFCSFELPRYIMHTNFILIPKKKQVSIFSDLRTICLSRFMNKILSRVIYG